MAKIDVAGKKFFHMNPKVDYDSTASEDKLYTMDFSRCNVGLGCSVGDVSADEATFYHVDESGNITPMSVTDIDQYVKRGRQKAVELRKISEVYHHGSIHGLDVYVVMDQSETAYRKTWSVISRDETPIVIGAKSDKIAIDRAAKLLRYGHHGQPTLDLLPKSVLNEWRRRQPRY